MCQLPWDCLTAVATFIATSVGIVLAVITFVGGIPEYIKRRSRKRAELIDSMRHRFIGDHSFRRFCEAIDKEIGDKDQSEEEDRNWDSVIDRYWWDLISFFEEVALMVNSKLMSENVAYEMFGYYAIRFSEMRNQYNNRHDKKRSSGSSMNFIKMNDLKGSRHLFENFLKSMIEIEQKKKRSDYEFNISDYRF
jgi:hypothetical protein